MTSFIKKPDLFSCCSPQEHPIYDAMKKELCATLEPDQQQIVTKRIKEIVAEAASNLGLDSIKISDLEKIRDEVKRIVLCVGNKKPLFKLPQEGKELCSVAKVFQLLFSSGGDIADILSYETASAVLWERDPNLLQRARAYVQKMLDEFDTEDGEKPTLAQSAAIENLLTIYPLFDPQEGEELRIPEWTENGWRRVPFNATRIQMTPDWLTSPIFAYGLVPKERIDNVFPKLLFKGTTYPTDNGALLSLLTNVNPGGSVGEYAFHSGFSELERWFAHHTGPNSKADVFGLSLGGSLALLAASHFGEKIRNAHAFGPPAPLPWSITKFDTIPEAKRPSVRIFYQSGDSIPKLGWGWHPAWKVHRVFASSDPGSLLAHAKAFTAEARVLILDINTETDSSAISRKAVAITQLIVAPILFALLTLVFIPTMILNSSLVNALSETREKSLLLSSDGERG